MLNSFAIGKRKIGPMPATSSPHSRLSLPLGIPRLGTLIDRWKKATTSGQASNIASPRIQSSRHLTVSTPGCLSLPSRTTVDGEESINSARSADSSSSLVDIHDALYPTTPTSPCYPTTPACYSTPPILKYPTPILTHSNSSNSLGKLLRWSDGTPPCSRLSSEREVEDSRSKSSSLVVRFPLRPASLLDDLHEHDEDAARVLAHKRHNSMPSPTASLTPESSSCPTTLTSSPAHAGVWLCSRPLSPPEGSSRESVQRPVVSTSVVRSSSDLSETDYIAAHRLRSAHPLKPRGCPSNSATAMCSLRRSIDLGSVAAERSRDGGESGPQRLFPSKPLTTSPASSVESYDAHHNVPDANKMHSSGETGIRFDVKIEAY